MFIAHGVGEHLGRYEKLGQHLADNGIFAFGHDHGKKTCLIHRDHGGLQP